MKVLSVDFDYFQNIPYDVLPCYPDGVDLPQEVSNIVWESRCRCYEPEFRRVEFDMESFRSLMEILKKQVPSVPVMIASSHVSAYYFIKELLAQSGRKRVDLINIDLHHDILNGNKAVDCGNWIGKLLEEKKIGYFEWVAKPLSQQAYGLSDEEMKKFHAHFDLPKILTMSFDAIFICRSDPWLLPSFDKYFDKMKDFCRSRFQSGNSVISCLVDNPRMVNARPLNKIDKRTAC